MEEPLPFAEACERNKQPILEALKNELPGEGRILEIGSATGQHIVWFAPRFPGLSWRPSDRSEYMAGLLARLRAEGADNIEAAIELDVLEAWPDGRYDAVYSSNTSHIMPWNAVCAMFRGIGIQLVPGGVFCLYGPFNEGGNYTSASNGDFDRHLKARDPAMGLRDVEALDTLAQSNGLSLAGSYSMPANNQVLVFRKKED